MNYFCFYNLFDSPDYNDRHNVVNNLNKTLNKKTDDNNKFILVVGTERPNIGDVQATNKGYELRVICLLTSNEQGNSPSNFDLVRFMRHGNKYKSWWKQERNHPATTQCYNENKIDKYFYQIIQLYVKQDNGTEDYWRAKFFECMGGKIHVVCGYNNFPLIPTSRKLQEKWDAICVAIHQSESLTTTTNGCTKL